MERAGETLPQPIIIIINGMGAGDVLLNGCGANGSKEKKVADCGIEWPLLALYKTAPRRPGNFILQVGVTANVSSGSRQQHMV